MQTDLKLGKQNFSWIPGSLISLCKVDSRSETEYLNYDQVISSLLPPAYKAEITLLWYYFWESH